jgi:hypothetical protein
MVRVGLTLIAAWMGTGCFAPDPPLGLPCGAGCPSGQRCDPLTATCIAEDSPDTIAVRFAEQTAQIDEGDGRDVAVELTGQSASEVTVTVTVAGTATRGSDYTLSSEQVVFAPGSTLEMISIATIDEALADPDETIELELTAPIGAVLGADTIYVATVLDTGVPLLRFDDGTSIVTEADTNHLVVVELSRPAAGDVSFSLMHDGGSAGSADFIAPTGTFTIAQGQLSVACPIAILQDALDEFDEDIELDLANATGNVTVSQNDHFVTIDDNDPPPTVAFGSVDTTAAEGAAAATQTFNFQVVLSTVSGRNVSVPVVLSGTAVDDVDYSIPGSDIPVAFSPGTTSRTIRVTVNGDSSVEPNETVIMTLQSSSGATLGATTTRTHTIVNDD